MRVHACVCDVFAIYDDDILPRLIMIIIKIIILYFIHMSAFTNFILSSFRIPLSFQIVSSSMVAFLRSRRMDFKER